VKVKRVVIGKHEYELTQLGAVEGRRLWVKVLKLLAPAIKELAVAGKLNEAALAMAVGTVIEDLDENIFVDFCKAFTARTRLRTDADQWPEMTEAMFDLHFAGRYIDMTKWLGECLLFNFGDYFGEASIETLSGMAREAGLQSPFQKGSTGTSGG